ncbi:amino acid ABC transporter ATP-binding protein [Acidisoma cladoniae]|uniref:amino acid ABC transporter ATP-binding protein n=1 Tax=Acidisoma cladoniae TaxID=3040935 RepID=UPI00254EFD1D|nr:amino acid ABC transporter ATP-binding protein [Acidisoma sp. PAMC 29798]
MPHLELKALSASYGRLPVLRDISLDVARGEVVSLIGPSGSGKSTLLRVLVGLLPPSGGTVRLDDQDIRYDNRASLHAARDKIAIVFQQYNLFQNMTVLANAMIAPVKIKGRDWKVVEAEARALLTRIGLGERLHAYPDQLSGGQQQRVAIARALLLRPEILLLDEVTSALDPERVSEVLDTISMLSADRITMLIVSHEMSFVREVSSRVVFMDGGVIQEIGSPAQIFDAPQMPRTQAFVSRILGRSS